MWLCTGFVVGAESLDFSAASTCGRTPVLLRRIFDRNDNLGRYRDCDGIASWGGYAGGGVGGRMGRVETFDSVIVGGGPAGLAAAIYVATV